MADFDLLKSAKSKKLKGLKNSSKWDDRHQSPLSKASIQKIVMLLTHRLLLYSKLQDKNPLLSKPNFRFFLSEIDSIKQKEIYLASVISLKDIHEILKSAFSQKGCHLSGLQISEKACPSLTSSKLTNESVIMSASAHLTLTF